MYCVFVYDVSTKRLDRVRGLLAQYMTWVQNSAFEGEVTPSQVREIKSRLMSIIDVDEDSVLIYSVPERKRMAREHLGLIKAEEKHII